MTAALEQDEHFMRLALREAEAAAEAGEIPIGAVVVHDGMVIGRGRNQNKQLQDPTAHAEIIAISAACNHLASRYLEDSALFVTIEPCAMCSGAIVLARVKRLVYGAPDPKAGFCGSLGNTVQDDRLNHQVEVTRGICSQECGGLISGFFRAIREKRL